jgi:hypothetical protein
MAPAFLLATALAAAPAALADVATPIWSGLPWRSGTSGIPNCLAALRGRAVDAGTLFLGNPNFPALVWQSSGLRPAKGRPPLLVVSLPLLPDTNKGQFAQCAAGSFDGSFAQIGANLQKAGAQGTVVRLGWEANIGSDSHPWGVDTPDQVPAYVACWRRAAAALKAGGPALNTEWTSAKKTANKALHVTDMYPGDDVVDVVGVHYYDSGPEKSTQAVWDKYYGVTFNGGPWGLGTWLDFARSRGKKLAVSEYGLWRQGTMTAAQADDPVYVDNMYRFFRGNAADLAYETYFNAMADQHALCNADGTPTSFPSAAAAYKADWSLGH